jgi:hypothetical protein
MSGPEAGRSDRSFGWTQGDGIDGKIPVDQVGQQIRPTQTGEVEIGLGF